MATLAHSQILKKVVQRQQVGHFSIARWVLHGFLIGVAALWLVPSLGLLVTSFRTQTDIASSGWWTVLAQPRLTLENYQTVLTAHGILDSFLNSFKITIPSTILPLFLASLAAYGFTWVDFPGRTAALLIVIVLMIIPLQITLVPILSLFNTLHLTGTYPAMWITHTGYALPFAIYLLHNAFLSVPKELIEAAKIDGASEWQVYSRIVMPISVPALAALGTFQFLWVWNDLLLALVFMSSSTTQPLTVRMQALLGTYASEWHIMSASAFVSLIVPLLVFFALQRYFVIGITAGAVKG
jgi:alpha-glucoside transport system permease protein